MAQNTRRSTVSAPDQTQKILKVISRIQQDLARFSETLETKATTAETQELQLTTESLTQGLVRLDSQLNALAKSKVGTAEHQRSLDRAAQALQQVGLIAAEMPELIDAENRHLTSAVESLKTPLLSMAQLLAVVVEMVEGPLSLSDDAVARLSVSVEKRLNAQLSGQLRTQLRELVDSSFKKLTPEFERTAERGVEALECEREAIAREREAIAREREALSALEERLRDRTLHVFSITLLAAVTAVGVIVVAGALWMGSSLLGITVAVPEMWSRAWAADTWWAGLGWALGAFGMTVATVLGIGWVATRTARHLHVKA